MTLAVVLVNHNGWRLTVACSRWLLSDGLTPDRLTVVDNGSSDGSPALLQHLLPGARLVCNIENRGFAAACNDGVALALASGAEAVLLINPDTMAGPGFLPRLVGGAGPLPDACVSPEVYRMDEPREVWFAGAWRGALPGTWQHRPPGHGRREVDYLWACCMLVGRSVWRRVGGLEPAFFLFYEDMDWCERASLQGIEMRVAPEARLWHAVGKSSRQAGEVAFGWSRRYHMSRSAVIYDRRWGRVPPSAAGWVRLAAVTRTAMRLGAAGERTALDAHLRGTRDGWRAVLPPTAAETRFGP